MESVDFPCLVWLWYFPRCVNRRALEQIEQPTAQNQKSSWCDIVALGSSPSGWGFAVL